MHWNPVVCVPCRTEVYVVHCTLSTYLNSRYGQWKQTQWKQPMKLPSPRCQIHRPTTGNTLASLSHTQSYYR